MATLLFVTDIWGQHATLDPLLSRLKTRFDTLTVLDPYSGQRFAFDDEAQAHGYFQRRCSAAVYRTRLREVIEASPEPLTLLACGAGANAAWPLLSESALAPKLRRAALCYGHEIPGQAELVPTCPVLQLLCRQDPGTGQNAAILARHSQVILSDADHGFLNPRTPQYDAEAARQAEETLLNWLSQD